MKAIIFDCDGTLADSMPIHYRAWRTTMARYGIDFSEERFYAMGGWPTRTIAALLGEENGVDLDPVAVSNEKETEYASQLDSIEPLEAVIEIARAHRGRTPMAVATGSERWLVTKTLTKLGIIDWFDAIVTADDVVHGKPAPDVFLEAARRIGVDPTDCVVYEDAEPGLEGARKAGMDVVDVRQM